MKTILRNILSVVLGLLVGSIVNMGIIMVSSSLIPPPEGADVTTLEGLQASMHLFQPKHFIMPFLAHALGTFTGAIVAVLLASNNKRRYAFTISVFFMFGGITNLYYLPSPLWFSITDLVFAYIPMAWAAHILFDRNKK
jgi:hypothetical protein